MLITFSLLILADESFFFQCLYTFAVFTSLHGLSYQVHCNYVFSTTAMSSFVLVISNSVIIHHYLVPLDAVMQGRHASSAHTPVPCASCMPNCLPENHKMRLFADDSNIFISSHSPKALKNELKMAVERILTWLGDNKLTVNLSKTQYSIFQTKNMTVPNYLNSIKINSEVINRVQSAKFLGIILDEKLKWDEHIKQLLETLTKITNAFEIIKHYVPSNKKPMLYFAYIYSRIQYGIEMYGTSSKTLMKKVQTKQNKAIKVLHNKNFFTPTTTLHKELNYPLVNHIEKINVSKFVHKQRNNKTPQIFNNLFTENKEIHTHNTRQSHNLATQIGTTQLSQKTIKYRGPRIWNSIPMKIRTLECNKNFGKKLRNHLIETIA